MWCGSDLFWLRRAHTHTHTHKDTHHRRGEQKNGKSIINWNWSAFRADALFFFSCRPSWFFFRPAVRLFASLLFPWRLSGCFFAPLRFCPVFKSNVSDFERLPNLSSPHSSQSVKWGVFLVSRRFTASSEFSLALQVLRYQMLCFPSHLNHVIYEARWMFNLFSMRVKMVCFRHCRFSGLMPKQKNPSPLHVTRYSLSFPFRSFWVDVVQNAI